MPALNKLSRDLRAKIKGADTLTAQRLSVLMVEVDSIISVATGEIKGATINQLKGFGENELAFTAKTMSKGSIIPFVTPSTEQVLSVINTKQFELVSGKKIKKRSLNGLFTDFDATIKKQVEATIQAGVIAGQSGSEIADSVYDLTTATKSSRTLAQTDALVRTATNQMASEARRMVTVENADLLRGEEWVATLDGRTTLVCSGRDGRIYPVGEPPYPPAHFNCRSSRVGVLKPEYMEKGLTGERAGENEQVTYGGWLKRQPKEVQNKVLGDERAKLFRSGEVSIAGFTDDRGRTLSLDELKGSDNVSLL